MPTCPHIASHLPMPLPQEAALRDTLIIFRRLIIHGPRDAQTSNFAMQTFGGHFRQVLVSIRCLIYELTAASRRRICVASCCAPRMTRDEALLIDAIRQNNVEALSAVMDNDAPDRAACSAEHLRKTLMEITPSLGD